MWHGRLRGVILEEGDPLEEVDIIMEDAAEWFWVLLANSKYERW